MASPHAIRTDDSAQAQRALADALRAILPADMILASDEALRPYECDGLSAYRQVPLAVVLPETVDQVQAILKLCHARKIPVVARGAGTGLSGGALPHAEGLVLSLARFNKILSIDPAQRIARVQPGVRNLAISEAAAPHGLYYAPDPSSQIACTIGGNVAENSGGVHCLKYGLTVHNVLRVKLITIDGETLTIGSEALDSRRLRPARAVHRLRRHARRRHGGHRAAAADPGTRPGRARRLRRVSKRPARPSAESSRPASFPPDWK